MAEPTYRLNPALAVLDAKKEDWRGNPFYNRQFRYLSEPFRPRWRTLLRWMITPNPQRQEKKQDTWRPPVHDSLSHFQESKDMVVWLGHSTFYIQLGGVRLLTDPMVTDLPMAPRLVRLPFKLKDLPPLDYILLSHDHRDHVDEETLTRLLQHQRPRKILAPLELSNVIADWVTDIPVEEAAWYQVYNTEKDHPRITFVPSRHWCRRGLFDLNRILWGGFVIEHGNRKLYFAGDSADGWHWEEVGRLFPDIDLAMIGIGAYCPTYMMKDAHCNPHEAWNGFEQTGARNLLPMHYGTYDLSDEPISEPYRLIRSIAEQAGKQHRLRTPAVNEPVWLEELIV